MPVQRFELDRCFAKWEEKKAGTPDPTWGVNAAKAARIAAVQTLKRIVTATDLETAKSMAQATLGLMEDQKFFLAVAANETDQDSATSMGVVRRKDTSDEQVTFHRSGGEKSWHPYTPFQMSNRDSNDWTRMRKGGWWLRRGPRFDAMRYWHQFSDFARFPGLQYFANIPELLCRAQSIDIPTVTQVMQAYNQASLAHSSAYWSDAILEVLEKREREDGDRSRGSQRGTLLCCGCWLTTSADCSWPVHRPCSHVAWPEMPTGANSIWALPNGRGRGRRGLAGKCVSRRPCALAGPRGRWKMGRLCKATALRSWPMGRRWKPTLPKLQHVRNGLIVWRLSHQEKRKRAEQLEVEAEEKRKAAEEEAKRKAEAAAAEAEAKAAERKRALEEQHDWLHMGQQGSVSEPAPSFADVCGALDGERMTSSESLDSDQPKIPDKFQRLALLGHLEVDAEIARGISLRESLRQGGRLWLTCPAKLDEKSRAADAEIARGISLRESLRQGGRLWLTCPAKLDEKSRAALWNRSRPVEHFDLFLSHTWMTAGKWKLLSLLLQSGSHKVLFVWVLGVGATAVLTVLGVLPSPWTVHVHLLDCHLSSAVGPWILLASALATVFGLLAAPYFPNIRRRSDVCFMDVASIHQSDTDLMERGIYGIGGFLNISSELRVLWSAPYLSSSWVQLDNG
eukprot:s2576_g6.t1